MWTAENGVLENSDVVKSNNLARARSNTRIVCHSFKSLRLERSVFFLVFLLIIVTVKTIQK